MNDVEELRRKIGKRRYDPGMDLYDFMTWHETLVGYIVDKYQLEILQALDDEELMARYARFIIERGE